MVDIVVCELVNTNEVSAAVATFSKRVLENVEWSARNTALNIGRSGEIVQKLTHVTVVAGVLVEPIDKDAEAGSERFVLGDM